MTDIDTALQRARADGFRTVSVQAEKWLEAHYRGDARACQRADWRLLQCAVDGMPARGQIAVALAIVSKVCALVPARARVDCDICAQAARRWIVSRDAVMEFTKELESELCLLLRVLSNASDEIRKGADAAGAHEDFVSSGGERVPVYSGAVMAAVYAIAAFECLAEAITDHAEWSMRSDGGAERFAATYWCAQAIDCVASALAAADMTSVPDVPLDAFDPAAHAQAHDRLCDEEVFSNQPSTARGDLAG